MIDLRIDPNGDIVRGAFSMGCVAESFRARVVAEQQEHIRAMAERMREEFDRSLMKAGVVAGAIVTPQLIDSYRREVGRMMDKLRASGVLDVPALDEIKVEDAGGGRIEITFPMPTHAMDGDFTFAAPNPADSLEGFETSIISGDSGERWIVCDHTGETMTRREHARMHAEWRREEQSREMFRAAAEAAKSA